MTNLGESTWPSTPCSRHHSPNPPVAANQIPTRDVLGDMKLRARVLRRSAAMSFVGSTMAAAMVVASTTPASAIVQRAARATTVLLTVDNTTTQVGSPVSFSGSVAPLDPRLSVTVQESVGGRWRVLSHVAVADDGSFAFRERTPKTASHWSIRVTRAASTSLLPGISHTQHLNGVLTAFTFTARATATTLKSHQRLTVTGSVHPATSGSLYLERRVPDGDWVLYAQARIGAHSEFGIVTTPLLPGIYTFRVAKFASPTVAGGAGRWFAVTVSAS